MEAQKSLLKLSLTFFNFLGVNPYKRTGNCRVYLFILLLLILYVLVFVRFHYEKVTFKLISDTFESNFTIIHVLSKLITLLVAKSTLKRLLQTTHRFWYNHFKEEFQKEVNDALKVLKLVLQLFLVFVTIVIVTFAIRPIFDNSLAIICYVPESFPRFLFIIFNNAIFVASAFAVCSFDMFFCVMISLISIQFKTLNHVIATLNLETIVDEKTFLRKIRKCVDYHNFLCEFLREVNAVISPALLVYFSIAPVTLCFELFFISKSSNFAEIAKSCVYVSGTVIELCFFFCLPATYLSIESERLIRITYDSGWENCYFLSIRKNLLIMMQRMQKIETLSAGKMIQINLKTCTNAFRMALSFYTSLRILDDNSKQN